MENKMTCSVKASLDAYCSSKKEPVVRAWFKHPLDILLATLSGDTEALFWKLLSRISVSLSVSHTYLHRDVP